MFNALMQMTVFYFYVVFEASDNYRFCLAEEQYL
jgi:hypothetical protein